MKNKITIIVFVFMLAIAGIVGGVCINNTNFTSAVEDSSTISIDYIEMSKIANSTMIEINGHFVEKEYCIRLTYTLTNLFVEDKLELENGYAKYVYTDSLWNVLNNIENSDYSIWQTEEYKFYAQTVAEDDCLFLASEGFYFDDAFGITREIYYYYKTTLPSVPWSGEDVSTMPMDKYGNYYTGGVSVLSDGSSFLMPPNEVSGVEHPDDPIRIEWNGVNWRVINATVFWVNVQIRGSFSGKCSYVEYQLVDKFELKEKFNAEDLSAFANQDLIGADAVKIEAGDQVITGKLNVQVESSGLVQLACYGGEYRDEIRGSVVYYPQSSGKTEGWYLMTKTTTTNATNARFSAKSSNIQLTSDSFDENGYTYTKLSSAPTIEWYDAEDTVYEGDELTAYERGKSLLKTISVSLPSTGIMFNNQNYTLPLVILGSMLVITGVVMLVTVKSKKRN